MHLIDKEMLAAVLVKAVGQVYEGMRAEIHGIEAHVEHFVAHRAVVALDVLQHQRRLAHAPRPAQANQLCVPIDGIHGLSYDIHRGEAEQLVLLLKLMI